MWNSSPDFVDMKYLLTYSYSRAKYAQTQFSVTEFRVQGQSSDFQCTRTTHYNAYLPEKGHNNAYSSK